MFGAFGVVGCGVEEVGDLAQKSKEGVTEGPQLHTCSELKGHVSTTGNPEEEHVVWGVGVKWCGRPLRAAMSPFALYARRS